MNLINVCHTAMSAPLREYDLIPGFFINEGGISVFPLSWNILGSVVCRNNVLCGIVIAVEQIVLTIVVRVFHFAMKQNGLVNQNHRNSSNM